MWFSLSVEYYIGILEKMNKCAFELKNYEDWIATNIYIAVIMIEIEEDIRNYLL